MFRLTEHRLSGRLVLKLEGRCSWEVIAELEASWQAARRAARGDEVWIDLSDVLLVDDAARVQLARMYKSGARFMWRGCLMHELVREITHAGVEGDEKGSVRS